MKKLISNKRLNMHRLLSERKWYWYNIRSIRGSVSIRWWMSWKWRCISGNRRGVNPMYCRSRSRRKRKPTNCIMPWSRRLPKTMKGWWSFILRKGACRKTKCAPVSGKGWSPVICSLCSVCRPKKICVYGVLWNSWWTWLRVRLPCRECLRKTVVWCLMKWTARLRLLYSVRLSSSIWEISTILKLFPVRWKKGMIWSIWLPVLKNVLHSCML